MSIIEYPKIETLYDRDEKTHKVIVGKLRCPEFDAVKRWHVTEKIDGMNVRVALLPNGIVWYGGRTDSAQMPPKLLAHLQSAFTAGNMLGVFAGSESGGVPTVLFGEGYGAGIQKGGIYRPDPSFRLFDVHCGGLWLTWQSVEDIALKLGIDTVPVLLEGNDMQTAIETLHFRTETGRVEGGDTSAGHNAFHEGIVARSDPLMLDRRGNRIMWKLKRKDF